MLRRLCLLFTLIVVTAMATAGTALAHLPWPSANPQNGCILPEPIEPWNPAPPYGPVDGSGLIAPAAPNNSCGKP